ncbi:hypothetical protein [Rhodococcus erythropolis]|uniref:hypothetical protein n=1 Tax=Rhodococcus erythropolis TaxID=1833 RepID=UPI00366B2D9E
MTKEASCELARIRTFKPEFWDSPDIETLEFQWRLLYMAMWNLADDTGRGKAEPRELLGFAFPRDYAMTSEDIRRGLGGIRRVFGVNFYKVSGRPYFVIPSWDKHQKIDKRALSRYPGPDEGEAFDPETNDAVDLQEQSNSWVFGGKSGGPPESPPTPRRELGAGTGEQGNRGTGEQGNRTTSDPASPDGSATTKATGSKPSDRGTRIAEDFAPTAEMIVWAKSERPDLDPMAETEHFVDFWLSKPGKDGRKVKWDLTWKNWIRNARSKGPVSQPGSSKTDEWLKYAE